MPQGRVTVAASRVASSQASRAAKRLRRRELARYLLLDFRKRRGARGSQIVALSTYQPPGPWTGSLTSPAGVFATASRSGAGSEEQGDGAQVAPGGLRLGVGGELTGHLGERPPGPQPVEGALSDALGGHLDAPQVGGGLLAERRPVAVVVGPRRHDRGRDVFVPCILQGLTQHAVGEAAAQLFVRHRHALERSRQGIFAAKLSTIWSRRAATSSASAVDAQAFRFALGELTAHGLVLGARRRVAGAAQAKLGAHGVDGALTDGPAVDEQDDRVGGPEGEAPLDGRQSWRRRRVRRRRVRRRSSTVSAASTMAAGVRELLMLSLVTRARLGAFRTRGSGSASV